MQPLFCYKASANSNLHTHTHKTAALLKPPSHPAVTAAPYLGTQLGDERSTSHVAYRFICTGRLEVIATGLEGCGDGHGAPPLLGSPPPRSDMLLYSRAAGHLDRVSDPNICPTGRKEPPAIRGIIELKRTQLIRVTQPHFLSPHLPLRTILLASSVTEKNYKMLLIIQS
ncbi:uncharacterized [Tachysurus ichikawai]